MRPPTIDEVRDLADDGRFEKHGEDKDRCARCSIGYCHEHDVRNHGCGEADPDAEYQAYKDQATDGVRFY